MPSRRPVIGITCGNVSPAGETPRYGTNEVYVRAVQLAGGAALVIPPGPRGSAAAILERLDGLLVPGGADVHPRFYGHLPGAHLERTDEARDETETALVRAAARRQLPVFAICRGLHLVNTAHGGTLYQDLSTEMPGVLPHRTPRGAGRGAIAHEVAIVPGSWFADSARARTLRVNSLHHQAVQRVGRGLLVTALSPDGVIEGLESPDRRVVGVQCHPEELPDVAWARRLFRSFIARARA
jgi:putative glutamine amidotransferase